MKKRKIMLLLPFTALILGGCSFQDVKNWVGSNIYFPVKNWVEDLFDPDGKKEEKKEEESAKLESIAISGDFKQEYELGEEFDKTGIIVTASYSDGSSKDVSSKASFEGFSSEAKGTVVVTVSFEGKTAELPLNIVKSHWTDSEKALFNQYLYGVELPFIDGDGFSLTYSNGWVYGSGCSLTGEELLAYEALFSEAAGYVDITDEYEDATDGSFKAFRGTASTQQGTRYFDVLMYTYTGNNYSLGGSFVLQAADTYEYSFPDTAALFAKYPKLTPFDIPTIELPDGGYFYVAEGQSNAAAYSYGSEYYTYMTLTVWGYNADQAAFDAFFAKFSAWTVTETSGAYQAKLSVDESHYALVNFSYSSSTKIIKYNITLGLYEVKFWPTASAAAIVESLVPGSTTVIPAFEGQEDYSVYTHEIDVDGPSSLLAEYIDILEKAQWTADPNADNTYISPAQDISVYVYYSSYWGLCIEIAKYIAPSADWPTDDVAALFPAGTQDVLPPFEGTATSFLPYDDSYKGVTVFVGEGNEESAMEEYAATLVNAGFTLSETKDGFYESPHKEYYVELWEGTDGAFNIEITIIAHWPTADVASALATLIPSSTDSLPALEGAASYALYPSASKLQIKVGYDTYSEASAAQTDYIALLLKAGFSYAGDDEYGDPYYNSPSGEFNVNPWVSGSSYSLILDIREGTFTPPTAGFDAAAMNAALKEIDSTLNDKLPEYETELTYSYYANDDGDGIQIMAMPDDVNAEISLFAANLLTNGFTEAGADGYGDMHYTSPGGELDVCAWNYYDYYIVIDVVIN